jgi:hypothetical protein
MTAYSGGQTLTGSYQPAAQGASPGNISITFDRLWESYYPTKAGVIVADQPHNYFVRPEGYSAFFPGAIVSVVGVSPSGCQAAFFGAKVEPVTHKNEVRLYTVRVC